jgi:3-deoxy-7-phosphoheptulonate synthase
MFTKEHTVSQPIDNVRISSVRPLISPALLREELPLSAAAEQVVRQGREDAQAILNGEDDRLLLVVGPCSVHDPVAALEYAKKLAVIADEVKDSVKIIMRVYFEKPRTTVGWKGLLNDPTMDGSYSINTGLRVGRQLLLDVLETGLPVGCEFLDPIMPQYIADAVSWGSIGARTAASQVHRQLTSGLSMPVGIKNSTEGDVQIAVDAVRAASASHVFPGVTPEGVAALVQTTGNADAHVILRGSSFGPNYDAATVATTNQLLANAGLPQRMIVDASHGNSSKDHNRQPIVIAELAARIAAGEQGVVGMMVESFLVEGRQDLKLGHADELVYGQSITDACVNLDATAEIARMLVGAVAARRPVSV